MGADGSMGRPYQPLLDQVLETLGSHVLSAAYVPEGEPVTVGEPEGVHDPADHVEEGSGRVLLAVGSATAELVGQAGLNGYHAVVVKDRGADLTPLVAAERGGDRPAHRVRAAAVAAVGRAADDRDRRAGHGALPTPRWAWATC